MMHRIVGFCSAIAWTGVGQGKGDLYCSLPGSSESKSLYGAE